MPLSKPKTCGYIKSIQHITKSITATPGLSGEEYSAIGEVDLEKSYVLGGMTIMGSDAQGAPTANYCWVGAYLYSEDTVAWPWRATGYGTYSYTLAVQVIELMYKPKSLQQVAISSSPLTINPVDTARAQIIPAYMLGFAAAAGLTAYPEITGSTELTWHYLYSGFAPCAQYRATILEA